MATAAYQDRAKKCKFFLNGDKTFTGKYLVLNRRRIRNWDSLLEEVTRSTKSLLPIRNICTPATGTQITQLDDLAEDGAYVAAPRRQFKKIDYLNLNSNVEKNKKPQIKNFDNIRPVEHSSIKVSAKARKTRAAPTTLILYINNQPFDGPFRVTIPNHMIRNGWNVIYNELDERVPMTTCIKKLYTLDYKRIKAVEELESFAEYIAVGPGKQVVQLPYGTHRPKFNNSPNARRRADSMPLPKARSRNQRSENSSSTGSTSNKSTKSQPTGGQRRKRPEREEDQVFHAKPVKHKRSPEKSKETDYDKDEGGIFRAKSQREDTMDAKEVDENRETKVELPVDQREAEEVDEEVSSSDEDGDTNEGNKTHRVKKKETPKQTPKQNSSTESPKPRPKDSPSSTRSPTPVQKAKSKAASRASSHSSLSGSLKDSPEPDEEKSKDKEKSKAGQKTPPASAKSKKQEEEENKKEEKEEENKEEEKNEEGANDEGDNQEEQEKAATKIQATYRGHGVRKKQKEDQKAAIKIQSNYRGYKTRKQLKNDKENDTTAEDENARDPPSPPPDDGEAK